MEKRNYALGQRWEFKPTVPRYESTFVISHYFPGGYWNGNVPTIYVYLRFTPEVRQEFQGARDGVTMSITEAALDKHATNLLEENIELPWWWQWGREYANQEDAGSCCESPVPFEDLERTLEGTYLRIQSELRSAAERLASKRAALDRAQQQKKGTKKKPAPKSIAESWQRLTAWYAEHAAEYSGFNLNPGATAEQIAAAEETLGVSLPDDFKESVQIHDGGDMCWIQPSYGELLSLERIVHQWKMYSEWQGRGDYAVPDSDDWRASKLRGPAKKIFWNTKRIHVSDNSGGHLTLDLDPPPEGVYGQVIAHDHEVGPKKVDAASWSEFLAALVKDHESGKYVYVPEEDSVRLVKELKG